MAKRTILVLAANPLETTRLRVDQEMREIRAALKRASRRERFVLEERQAVRPDDLRQAMLDLKPQIVHFCGHGAREKGLILESSSGNGASTVGAEALARLFALFANDIECVVLNSCYSEVHAEPVAKSIPFVVGMRKQVRDDAAIKFAVGFYDALGAGESIERAFYFGKNAIELELAGVPDFLWPVLLKGAVPPRGGTTGSLPTDYSWLVRMSEEEIRAAMQKVAKNDDDPDDHLSLGLFYQQLKLHELAQRQFQKTFELAPDSAEAHYYYALSLIRCRRPRSLGMAEVKAIESHLTAAIELDGRRSKYYYLLAIVRYDYYRGNGLGVPRPNDAELLDAAQRREPDPWEVERLLHGVTVREPALVARIRRQS
jgi:tetratricopeptide (TPR) repeat protein